MKHLRPQGLCPGAVLGARETESCPQGACSPVITELGFEPNTSDTFSSNISLFFNLTSLFMGKKSKFIKNFQLSYRRIFHYKAIICKLRAYVMKRVSVNSGGRSITWGLLNQISYFFYYVREILKH